MSIYRMVLLLRQVPRAVRVHEALGHELPARWNGGDAGRRDFVAAVEAAYVGVDVGTGEGDLRVAFGCGDADVEADVDGEGEGEEGEEGGEELHGERVDGKEVHERVFKAPSW